MSKNPWKRVNKYAIFLLLILFLYLANDGTKNDIGGRVGEQKLGSMIVKRHKPARITPAVLLEIQQSTEIQAELAYRYNVTPDNHP